MLIKFQFASILPVSTFQNQLNHGYTCIIENTCQNPIVESRAKGKPQIPQNPSRKAKHLVVAYTREVGLYSSFIRGRDGVDWPGDTRRIYTDWFPARSRRAKRTDYIDLRRTRVCSICIVLEMTRVRITNSFCCDICKFIPCKARNIERVIFFRPGFWYESFEEEPGTAYG